MENTFEGVLLHPDPLGPHVVDAAEGCRLWSSRFEHVDRTADRDDGARLPDEEAVPKAVEVFDVSSLSTQRNAPTFILLASAVS
mmetsp:Transcript_65703/g.104026  ORF Transcript_65703/g.104026 Transcript_65703/m.104026 type:complete len:84 (+) Transcript_65703:629-880(+)